VKVSTFCQNKLTRLLPSAQFGSASVRHPAVGRTGLPPRPAQPAPPHSAAPAAPAGGARYDTKESGESDYEDQVRRPCLAVPTLSRSRWELREAVLWSGASARHRSESGAGGRAGHGHEPRPGLRAGGALALCARARAGVPAAGLDAARADD